MFKWRAVLWTIQKMDQNDWSVKLFQNQIDGSNNWFDFMICQKGILTVKKWIY